MAPAANRASAYGTNNLAWFTRDDGCSNGNAYSWFTLDLGTTRHVLSFEFRPSAGGPGGPLFTSPTGALAGLAAAVALFPVDVVRHEVLRAQVQTGTIRMYMPRKEFGYIIWDQGKA